MRKYFLIFESRDQMMREFSDYGSRELPIDGFPTDDEILFASYAPGCYCGDAVVVFQRDGKFYMNEASHCSCYGLENQWGPDEIDPAMLLSYGLVSDHGAEVQNAFGAMAYRVNNVQ